MKYRTLFTLFIFVIIISFGKVQAQYTFIEMISEPVDIETHLFVDKLSEVVEKKGNSMLKITIDPINSNDSGNTSIPSSIKNKDALQCENSVSFVYADEQVTYGTVLSATGRCWLDRNLGASRVAISMTDEQAYGDLFQWGRAADGHQYSYSETTSILSSTDQPDHGSFILATDSPYDWRSPQNNNLWLGFNGINNPCPDGYRLPTETEWDDERQSWSRNSIEGAFASPLKLPAPGARDSGIGSRFAAGSSAEYWSGTVSDSNAHLLFVGDWVAGIDSKSRAFGFPVRCIKD